jgi:5-formyltetrahydrofolate cyclo-ligase
LKAQQRRQLQARRAALSVAERMAAADAVATNVCRHPQFARPGYVAGYWATRAELPLHALQLKLRPDQVWCLPVVQPDGSLLFGPWRQGDALVSNRYGIPEPDLAMESLVAPKDLSLVLLPLLGFDRLGHRLGMGGGYYDRSFAFRRGQAPPPVLVGVAYACQEVDVLGRDEWDVPLDALASERELLGFDRG